MCTILVHEKSFIKKLYNQKDNQLHSLIPAKAGPSLEGWLHTRDLFRSTRTLRPAVSSGSARLTWPCTSARRGEGPESFRARWFPRPACTRRWCNGLFLWSGPGWERSSGGLCRRSKECRRTKEFRFRTAGFWRPEKVEWNLTNSIYSDFYLIADDENLNMRFEVLKTRQGSLKFIT